MKCYRKLQRMKKSGNGILIIGWSDEEMDVTGHENIGPEFETLGFRNFP